MAATPLAASVVGGKDGWRTDGKEGGGGEAPAPNYLCGYTGRHFEEGVALGAPS